MKHSITRSGTAVRIQATLLLILVLSACTGRRHEDVSLDHIILAIHNLDSGVNQFRRLTGVEPTYGGMHPNSYTQNALFSVGRGTYVEILAPRSDLDSVPDDFKKFDQLTPIGWAISTKEIERTKQTLEASGFKVGNITPGSRVAADGRELKWSTCVIQEPEHEDSNPFFISWSAGTIHPSETSAAGCELGEFKIRAREASTIDRLRKSLDMSDSRLVVEQSDESELSLTLRTPKGEVVISSRRSLSTAVTKLRYAKHFTVDDHGSYKVVKTHATIGRWGSEESQTLQDVMVLYQKGTVPPALVDELQGAALVQVPVNRVATNLESTERFLEEFGSHTKMQAVGGLISYNDSIRQLVLRGKIGQIGYSWHQPPNQEVLLEKQVDLFLMTISNLDFKDGLEKCRQLGIPTATVFDWAESNYLAQAEWIKYFALFFNEEAEAERIFNDILKNVQVLKAKVGALPQKPTAMWGYYTGKGRWLMHRNSVEAQLLRDAGAENVFFDSTRAIRNGGEPLSTEQLMEGGQNVTHWVIGDIHSAELPGEQVMSTFAAWRSGSLYHNMKRSKPEVNAYDWYGSAPVRPDYVLADLVKLLHPHIIPDHELIFMDRFDKRFRFPVNEGAF